MRLLRAYWTLLVVLTSYLRYHATAAVRGAAWGERTLPDVHRRNARRVERAIVAIQGLFIKVGQLISILTNFLPEEFRAELEGLQDQIPPRPLAEVEHRIERELGAPPAALFASFDPEPLAAASLAQVHAATIHDGRRVAVKVQHADIERTARSDLGAIRVILAVVAAVTGVSGLRRVFPELRAMVLGELDFAREADNLRRVAANFAGEAGTAGIVFPEPLAELSTARVLTATFVDGVKVSDVAALRALGLEPRAVAERVVRAYCEMVFRHGLYHADPHPGNILVQNGRPPESAHDATLAFVDFGAVAELSPRMKEGIPRFLDAVLRRDPARILAALKSMGFIAHGSDEEVAERVIGYVQSRFLDEVAHASWGLKDVQVDARAKIEALADLRRMEVSLRDLMAIVDVPREWILLERTNLLLLGLCTHLDPAFNPFTVIRPYLQELLAGGEGDWVERVGALAKDTALAALALPTDLRRLAGKAQRGDLEVRVRGLRESAEVLYALGHQFLWAACAMFSAAFAWQAKIHGEPTLGRWAAGAGLGFGVLFLGALLRGRRVRRRSRR
jgi:predicted unusual protein kinase regulating ubiquinone biosynthesis (AarF/ABC1/UbiB family)